MSSISVKNLKTYFGLVTLKFQNYTIWDDHDLKTLNRGENKQFSFQAIEISFLIIVHVLKNFN